MSGKIFWFMSEKKSGNGGGGILITKKKFIPLHDIGKNVLVYAIENARLRYRLSKS
jgi:hypothetical protein